MQISLFTEIRRKVVPGTQMPLTREEGPVSRALQRLCKGALILSQTIFIGRWQQFAVPPVGAPCFAGGCTYPNCNPTHIRHKGNRYIAIFCLALLVSQIQKPV